MSKALYEIGGLNVEQEVELDLYSAIDAIKEWSRLPSKEEQAERFFRFKNDIPEETKKIWKEKYGEEGYEYLCALNFADYNGHLAPSHVSYFVNRFEKKKEQ